MEKNPYNYSPATLKALERFGKNYSGPKFGPTSKPDPLPLPGTDWELWAHMPKATLAEAVAVSLGLDPRAIKPRSGYVEPGKDFERRLKLACAFVSHTGPLKSLDALPPNHLMDGPATATVNLPHFAAWALSMGWELPEKFPRLKAAPPKPATNSTAPATPATQNPLYVAIQQIVKSELQKHKPAPVVPIEPQAAPVMAESVSETTQQRCARYLAMFETEEKRDKRGALQRVADSEGVDRSNMRKDIDKARAARVKQNRDGFYVSQLVQDGKRKG